MESYRVTGIPPTGPQRGNPQPSHPSRPQSNGGGTYGLSIRVQGIDGHPYVVLNNQDRGPQSFLDPNSNGYIETEGSFIDNYHEYDFRGDKDGGPKSPFGEYRSQKIMQYVTSQNGSADSQGRKAQNLLNFQRHPEILQPYDPETNSLNFHSVPSRPLSLTETETQSTSTISAPSHSRSSSLDQNKAARSNKNQLPTLSPTDTSYQKPKLPSQSLGPDQNSQPQTKPQVALPQSKPRLSNQSPPQPKPTPKSYTQAVSSPTSEQNKTQSKSPSSVTSANSSLDRKHREPDVLPLRRSDSSGPVLQSSSRSRHLSSPSTSKLCTDESIDPLYADTINRHENRRYIPFVPGSGRDIDTGSIAGVDELIERFDGKVGNHHRRGRAGRRNRINPEDRKRSHSVDSAFGRGASSPLDESSRRKGTSMEHVLRPSQLRMHRTAGNQDPWFMVNSKPPSRTTSAPGSPQSTLSTGVGYIQGYPKTQSHSTVVTLKNKDSVDSASSAGNLLMSSSKSTTVVKKASTDSDVQATPDLLKGQQELSQQTHDETAKQILFNYLKDGSTDNDETTKRKVNLVFEKIQTLKSRATAGPPDDKSLGQSAQTKALQEQNAALEKRMAELKQQLHEQRTKNKADSMAASNLKELQQELDRTTEECKRLKEKLSKTELELQTTLEELFQVKMEREQYQTEIRDLQDQLSEMHDELDTAKTSAADDERDAVMADIMQLKVELQEVLLAKEEQEDVLRRRERELTALKGALKEEVAVHDQEMDKMKETYEKEMGCLQRFLDEAKQSSTAVVQEKAEVEAAKGALEGQAGRLSQEAERLRRRAQELENEVAKLNRIIDDAKLQESRLGERVARMEKEKKQLEESLSEIKEQEEEVSRANRALTLRLEDVQRNFSKMSSEHKELEERLREERDQKEHFKNMKNDIEDERRLLDRTVEKLQKEMNDIVDASQSSTRELQAQIDIYKEKNRRELTDLQKLLKERGQELDKYLLAAQTLQEELSQREEDLRRCQQERDEAVLSENTLAKKVNELEAAVQTSAHSKDDRARQFKLMEDRIAQLELDLDEERQNGDQLMDRLDRGREQVDQMRNELMQERAGRQDAECDKMALERQSKDLKNKLADLEGSQKSSKVGQVAQLEDRIRELEERLEGEERERANLQLSNRRLERKVKEVMMQVEEEHHTMQDQKDQLNLRLKALKRQMDEAEEEIDRLEHCKKKLQRDLDEQQETNEQLQSQLKSLRSEMRRKSTSAPLLNNLDDDEDDDDDMSTDGETYFSSASSYKRSSSQDNLLSTFSL
ncbi:cingulin-like protein 1 [Syngnathoides biaculeatus]|uniref:cingulin-like protein 1 n=1 Tax=Syngnathoides biaculeatus TaxID=300417 RepID=UPI002ADE667B|nr:cingulin-like protein 1 [Syngnathoides biaculeatus]